jgi:DNA-binding CsgD family transcriptional regulator
VEFQTGDIDAAERHAREAARLAARTRSWIHFICAHSILLSLAVRERDDHSAALWHAQQIGFAAQRTGDRRHQVYALSAQYVFEVERGRRDRALAIEADMPPHTLGFRDELDCCVALATRRSWDGEFAHAFREVARLNERVVEPERRFWNACLALFAAFAGDERAATMHLRACGKIPARVARENELGNAVADCYAAIAQLLLGNPEGALRRLPARGASSQIRALASFVREVAALGVTLARDTAAEPIKRLKVLGQGGMAQAVEAALASRAQPATVALTDAERRVLQAMARGGNPKAIAQLHDRSLHTIRNQIKALNRKLGASGSMDAVAKARILGLLE